MNYKYPIEKFKVLWYLGRDYEGMSQSQESTKSISKWDQIHTAQEISDYFISIWPKFVKKRIAISTKKIRLSKQTLVKSTRSLQTSEQLRWKKLQTVGTDDITATNDINKNWNMFKSEKFV